MSFITVLVWLVASLAAYNAYTDKEYFLAGMFMFQVLIAVLGDIADAIKDKK